ncbi:MAG: exodeoxyribonuclease V subunit alpha [Candidatus Spyradosoma sp.]
MNADAEKSFCPEARWLAAEIVSIARDCGVPAEGVARLEKLALRLAEAVYAENATCLRLAREELALLRELVGVPGASALVAAVGDGVPAPLVFDAETAPDAPTLYFRRQFEEEGAIARQIRGRLGEPEPVSEAARTLLRAGGAEGFGFALADEQRAAAELILSRPLALVSGGPGTGKTTLLLRALACVLAENPDAKIALAAPTGKAAARIRESLVRQIAAIDFSRVRDENTKSALRRIAQLDPKTVYRLLGVSPERRRVAAPLDADLVVVDEASMISQNLAALLLGALPSRAKLVLLGDADQLESVMPGHVFGELCGAEGLAPCRARLECGHRFRADSFLGGLARRVLEGDAPGALAALGGSVPANVFLGDCGREGSREKILAALAETFPPELRAPAADADPAALLALLETTRVLTPTAEGAFGKNAINTLAEAAFASGARTGDGHFHGRPIVVTKNDPAQGLNNGDVGVVLRSREDGRFYAWFADEHGNARRVPTAFLPPHESAYATTIHKSQGSEFSRLCVFFPPSPREGFCTRPLLYTALTRFRETRDAAKSRLAFYFSPDAVRAAVLTLPRRSSLLAARIFVKS